MKPYTCISTCVHTHMGGLGGHSQGQEAIMNIPIPVHLSLFTLLLFTPGQQLAHWAGMKCRVLTSGLSGQRSNS